MPRSLIIVLVILTLIAVSLPTWPYMEGVGYGPSGVLITILIIVLILWLIGYL